MEVQEGKSIWDNLPEDWEDLPKKSKHLSVEPGKKTSRQGERQKISDENTNSDAGGAERQEINTAKEPDHIGKRELRRREKEKIREFDRRSREEQMNNSEHARRAFEKEKKGNRRDFMIVGIVAAAVVVCIAAGVLRMTNASSQKIYNLIDQGNYSTAYREIEELYEKNKNVDSLVYAFAEKCVTDSEYKRAVASLEFLSSQAEDETDFFETIIEELLSHGKENRAEEVLNYMQEQGGALSDQADELLTKYEDQF